MTLSRTCLSCGHALREEADKCPECGAALYPRTSRDKKRVYWPAVYLAIIGCAIGTIGFFFLFISGTLLVSGEFDHDGIRVTVIGVPCFGVGVLLFLRALNESRTGR